MALILGVVILFALLDLNKEDKRSQTEDRGRRVTIYTKDKVIHTYEKHVKVVGDEVIFDNDYTEMKFKNAKVKYGE